MIFTCLFLNLSIALGSDFMKEFANNNNWKIIINGLPIEMDDCDWSDMMEYDCDTDDMEVVEDDGNFKGN